MANILGQLLPRKFPSISNTASQVLGKYAFNLHQTQQYRWQTKGPPKTPQGVSKLFYKSDEFSHKIVSIYALISDENHYYCCNTVQYSTEWDLTIQKKANEGFKTSIKKKSYPKQRNSELDYFVDTGRRRAAGDPNEKIEKMYSDLRRRHRPRDDGSRLQSLRGDFLIHQTFVLFIFFKKKTIKASFESCFHHSHFQS